MKVIIYTCNLNNYDTIKPVRDIDPNTQYLYYTNLVGRIDGWQLLKADMSINEDPIKVARYYKINSHLLPPHEYSIWVDASFELKSLNVLNYIKNHLGKDNVACYYHGTNDPKRNCLYMELAVTILNNTGDRNTAISQMKDYHDQGYPVGNDLVSTGIIIRRNNSDVKRFNKQWWSQVQKYSHRDQTSQMYASWKENVPIQKIQEQSVYNNELTRYVSHVHRIKELKRKSNIKRVKSKHNEIPTSISDNTETLK